jgi:hypothetical protein
MKTRFTEEQIIKIVKNTKVAKNLDIVRENNISLKTSMTNL